MLKTVVELNYIFIFLPIFSCFFNCFASTFCSCICLFLMENASSAYQVLLIFSHLVNASLDKFQVALSRVLQVFYI